MQKALWSQNIWKGVNEAVKMSKRKTELKHCELSYVLASCCRMREIKLDTIIENLHSASCFPVAIISCCYWTYPLASSCYTYLQPSRNPLDNALPIYGTKACSLFSQILFNTHFLDGSLTSFLLLLFTSAHLLDSCHAFQVCFCYVAFPCISCYLPLNWIHPLE